MRQSHLLPEQTSDALMSDASLDLALREQAAHMGEAPAKRNVARTVHRLLRGKYIWLAVLGVACAAAAGYAGWKKGSKTYASTSAIRIKFQREALLAPNQEQFLANADGFVQDQITNLTSWKLLVKAVQQPAWLDVRPNFKVQENDPSAVTLAVQDLVRRVKVSQKNDQVQVEVRDVDPAVAEAGAKAIINAYEAMYINVETDDPRIPVLQTKVKEIDNDLQSLRKLISDIAEKRGSEDLDATYNSRREAVDRMEQRISELRTALEVAKQEKLDAANDSAATQGSQGSDSLTMQEAWVNDPDIVNLMNMQRSAEFSLERAKRGTSRIALTEAQEYLDSIKRQMEMRVVALNKGREQGIAVPGVPAVKSESDLKRAETSLAITEPLYQSAVTDLEALAKDNSALKQYHRREADLLENKLKFTSRIDQLNLENNPINRRVEIASPGDKPLLPDKDSRPKYAIVCGSGGFMGAAGFLMLLGFLNGKVRNRRDLQLDIEDKPLIGLIPQLQKGQDSSKMAATAAEYVHRSRTMLEIWARGSQKLVVGVTSPSHGSGNTSVAMSLGVSFATAGIKTLLIDVDFVTNGLTPRLQTVVRRELGKVLLRCGMISDEKLEMARKVLFEESGGKVNGSLALSPSGNGNGNGNGHNGHSGYSGNGSNGMHVTNAVNPSHGANKDKSLGATCIKLGFITQEQLDKALKIQAREPVGLLDALSGEPLENCIGKTGIRNLSLLPRGNVTPAHAAKLSSHSMRQVLAAARQQYDTVIVDTSAIPTSLEAAIVASTVDGMVMTVARGERRSRLMDAMGRLNSMGCPVAGVIFNHVSPKDMPPELNIGRVSTMNANLEDEETIRANAELVGRLATLGPLASSMVARVPLLDDKVSEDDQ